MQVLVRSLVRGPARSGGSSPVPWVVTVQISDYGPSYAATVYQTIATATGGTSMGPQGSCTGTGGVGPTTAPAPSTTTAPPAATSAPTVAPTTPVPTTPAPAPALSAGVLPDSSRTPGVTDPAVTQANIGSTICKSGWTATVRPPESYTENLKEEQLDNEGYSAGRVEVQGDYG